MAKYNAKITELRPTKRLGEYVPVFSYIDHNGDEQTYLHTLLRVQNSPFIFNKEHTIEIDEKSGLIRTSLDVAIRLSPTDTMKQDATKVFGTVVGHQEFVHRSHGDPTKRIYHPLIQYNYRGKTYEHVSTVQQIHKPGPTGQRVLLYVSEKYRRVFAEDEIPGNNGFVILAVAILALFVFLLFI